MQADLLNQEGEKIGKVDLPDKVFSIALAPDFLHQPFYIIKSFLANPLLKPKTEAR